MRALSVCGFALVLLSIGCNKAPSAPAITIEPELPGTGDNLLASITKQAVDDNAKDSVAYTYTWYQDGLERGDLREDTVPASLTTKGELWEIEVTPSDGKVDGAVGAAATTIDNTAPNATVELSPAMPVAEDDLEVSATGTDPDGDVITFAYSWTVDGVDSSHAGDTVPAVDTLRGQVWEVTIVPNDGEDPGEPVTVGVTIDNTAPAIVVAELGPEPAFETTTLEALYVAEDIDGDAVSASYAFYVNGSLVQDSTDPTINGDHFDKGQQVRAVVTPTDGFANGNPANTNTVEILNSPPTYMSATLDPAEIYEDSTVSCVAGAWNDFDGDTEGSTTAWYVEGNLVSSDRTIDGGSFDRGDELYCELTPHDGEEAGDPVTSDVATIWNTAPSVASATLSSTSPSASDAITVAVAGASDADGDSITLGYAWYVGGVVVSTLPSLAGSAFVKGDTIYVDVTPSDGRDDGATVTSDVATAVNSLPVVTSLLVSPTTIYTDSDLVGSAATSDGDGDSVSLSYAWYVDGSVVGGSSDTLAGDTWFDKGQSVHLVVTPNDGESDGATAASSASTVLNTLPTAPTIGITPTEPEGGTDDLLCEILTTSSDADGDTVTYGFSWTNNGAVHTGAQLDDATSSLVPAIDTDDNQTWLCTATPDDGEDAGPPGLASVDIGEGGGVEPCVYPDDTLVVSTGPASSTFNPYLFTIDFIGTIHSDVVYDWDNGSGDQPAYIEFEFYDSTPTSICSVYYDLDSAVPAFGWSTSSGGALYGQWEVPLVGGYTTCPAVSSATWGTRDLRDLLEDWTWGVGVGEMVDLASTLPAAVVSAGLDWTHDWAPYVSSMYVYSDLYGQAYELGWAWGWEEECGVLTSDTSGDGIKISAPTASPLPDATWDGSGWSQFYASALVP